MSKDLEAIIQFIEQPNTDFAYMVTGAWGSGKTYFWKHVVQPWLLRNRTTSSDLVAYVSLYGMEGADEIRAAIFGQLHPYLEKAGRLTAWLAPAVGSNAGITLPDLESPGKFLRELIARFDKRNRLIVCFDDLDRTSIPIDVALGQINQFVEHVGAKVVILCNEHEICPESVDLYRKTKEKIVRISRVYTGDPVQVLPAIIAEFVRDRRYHKFLKQNHDLIADLLRRSGLKNLRVLKYSLLVLHMVFKELSKLLPPPNPLHTQYLRTLLPVTFDVQVGRISVADARSFLTDRATVIVGAYYGSKKDDEPQPLAAFIDRYGFGGLDDDTPESQALADLIETGYLDSARLKAEINARNAEQSPHRQAVDALLNGWFELPDDQIHATVAAALDAVRQGEITSAQRLHNLANVLDWMGREGVAGISDGTAESAFEEGIKRVIADGAVPERDFFFLEHSDLAEEHETTLGRHMRAFMAKAYADYKSEKSKRDFDAALNGLESDPNRFSFFLSEDQDKGIGRRSMAEFVSAQALAEALLSASNEVRCAIAMAFRRRYSERYRIEALVDDLPWLEEFQNIIERHWANSRKEQPARNVNLRRLRDYVKAAISGIKKIRDATPSPVS